MYDNNISYIIGIDCNFIDKTSNEILERSDARGIFEGNRVEY